MKIQYCSDLHLEFPENNNFIENNPVMPIGEILILAGDIVPFSKIDKHQEFFDYISDKFKFVYWIAGNHEYYHSNIQGRVGTFKEEIRENVYLVNNLSVYHENVQFVLSTLWSKISQENAWIITNSLNDFRLISYNENRFTTHLYNQLFEENCKFIQDAVRNNEAEKCIVVTHHVPTLINYPKKYSGSKINEAFATNLNDFIESYNIDFWIYGHHHSNTPDFKIGNSKLVTNQLGYVHHREHLHFDTGKIIET